MRSIRWPVFFLSVSCAVSCFAQDALQQGVQHFKAGQYREAVNDFRAVVDANPQSVIARLYLATALEMQFVPGLETAANLQFATDAISAFRKVLDQEPRNVMALASIASIYYNEKDFVQAAEWNKKVIEVDPNNKEAYYTLGVLAWTDWLPVDRQARTDSNQRPEDLGPIANAQLRESLKAHWMPTLDQAEEHMRHALQIDPDYADAMVYTNLLIRYRADLDDTTEEWKADSARADMWLRRASASKKAAAGAQAPAPVPAPSPNAGVSSGYPGGVLVGIIGSLSPAPQSQPGNIRIGSNVSAANLISKVDPVYPPLARQARVSGTVRFNVSIDREGHVENMTLISGHPLLVDAARNAVLQWVYQPVLLNGQPVKILTTIDVNFSLTQ